MGIRPALSEVYGVKLSRKEVKAFKKNADTIFSDFIKPWLDKMRSFDNNSFLINNYTFYYKDLPNITSLHSFYEATYAHKRTIWFPIDDDCHPDTLIGWETNSSYCEDIFYSLFPLVNASNKIVIKKIPKGKKPWEAGVIKIRNMYHTYNLEQFIPEIYIPNKDAKEEIFNKIQPNKSFDAYIEIKKELWYKYCGNHIQAYRVYPHDMWYESYLYFNPIDLLYKLITDKISDINYDPDRLHKYLIFHWH